MEDNKAILEEEISCKLLVTFLKMSLEREQNERKINREKSKKEAGSCSSEKQILEEDLCSLLQHRFPRDHWEQAILYFS